MKSKEERMPQSHIYKETNSQSYVNKCLPLLSLEELFQD